MLSLLSRGRRTSRRALGLGLGFALGLFAFGCAAPADDAETDQAGEEFHIPIPGGGGFGIGGATGQVVAGPNGLFSTVVNANGSGCPKGSWNAAISPDGQTFTVTFSQYEAQIGPGQSQATKDCALDLALLGTANLKFEIGSFYYQGYVALDNPQMSAVESADYTFNAAGAITGLIGIDIPLPGELHSQSVIGGPVSQSYLNTDNVGGGKWSPCGKANDLHIRTHLKLENDPALNGSGYVNDSTVDGSLRLGFKMTWQTC
jgi:hypothetical protein